MNHQVFSTRFFASASVSSSEERSVSTLSLSASSLDSRSSSGPKHTLTPSTKPVVFIILDGVGERQNTMDNAVTNAYTPVMDELRKKYPMTTLSTSGQSVGLPPGQMGNSEVGHLNFGAGRIAMMELSRIDQAIYENALGRNDVIHRSLNEVLKRKGRWHLFTLLSDGGVHSSISHAKAMIALAQQKKVPVLVHAFLDGRDVAPQTADRFIAELERCLSTQDRIATVGGRYYAMDRDKRWDRIEKAFLAITFGTKRDKTPAYRSAEQGIRAALSEGMTDEFVLPFVVGDYHGVEIGRDVGFHLNFRPDRARELTRALTSLHFDEFERHGPAPFLARDESHASYTCMTTYDPSFKLPVAFVREHYPMMLGEVVSRAGKKQFRCAETEKYAHVTYFFNGGLEAPYEGEERQLIPSPKDVFTYDQKPEMSAELVADAVLDAIQSHAYDLIVVNFANGDMVGHTGNLDAAKRAVEALDIQLGKLVEATLHAHGVALITADHGNCEMMRDPITGSPHTSHTTFPVPFFYVCERPQGIRLREGGKLADVAPTILELMGLSTPEEMTGQSLRINLSEGVDG